MYRTFDVSADQTVYLCIEQYARQHSFIPNRMQSVVSVMTNLKPCHLPIPHFTVVFIGQPHLWFSACRYEVGVFIISRVIRVFIAVFVLWNFECDPNVAQLKDVEFIPIYVGLDKFQISLCIFFNMRKLFLYFVQCIFVFCNGFILRLHCGWKL